MSETGKHVHLFVNRVRLERKAPPISLELRPQVHALVAASKAQGDEFIYLASGMKKPRRGRVHLGSVEPSHTPELRTQIGSLLCEEPQLASKELVASYVQKVLSLRKRVLALDTAEPDAKTVPLIGGLLQRACSSLTNAERRRLALGLALSLSKPALLLLHDPFKDLMEDEVSEVLAFLCQAAESGTIAACVVPNLRSARQISTRVHRLDGNPTKEEAASFLIRSERVREVASVLAKSLNIVSTRVRASGDLIVQASSEEKAAADITKALVSTRVEVFEVRRIAASEKEPSHA